MQSLKVKSKREVLEELTASYWQAASAGDQQQEFTDGAGGYTYTELLTRVYVKHRERNPPATIKSNSVFRCLRAA